MKNNSIYHVRAFGRSKPLTAKSLGQAISITTPGLPNPGIETWHISRDEVGNLSVEVFDHSLRIAVASLIRFGLEPHLAAAIVHDDLVVATPGACHQSTSKALGTLGGGRVLRVVTLSDGSPWTIASILTDDRLEQLPCEEYEVVASAGAIPRSNPRLAVNRSIGFWDHR